MNGSGISSSPLQVIRLLEDSSEQAVRLRQNSPFVSLLPVPLAYRLIEQSAILRHVRRIFFRANPRKLSFPEGSGAKFKFRRLIWLAEESPAPRVRPNPSADLFKSLHQNHLLELNAGRLLSA
jgi:hypothetical protein